MTKKQWMREFANRILERLGDLDMSQGQLANLTGITQSNISSYLSCNSTPSAPRVCNIARALNLEPGYLLDFGEMVEV